MGESLHDMMLRNIGISYDSNLVHVLRIHTEPEKDVNGEELLVHTVRFIETGQRRETPEPDDAAVIPRRRKRKR